MIYLYVSEETARAIVMTAHYLGFNEVHCIGSAVMMEKEVYEALIARTPAPYAVIVAQEVDED